MELITYQRIPLFTTLTNITDLQQALNTVLVEMSFQLIAGVVLPDHLHFLWTLPEQDSNYSKRIGRMKVLFTQSLKGKRCLPKTANCPREW